MQSVRFITAALLATAWSAPGATPSLPLLFEKNAGQAPESVSYLARTPEGTVLLGANGATLLPRGGGRPVSIALTGARAVRPEATEPAASVTNYFAGNDPARWRRGVRHFSKIRYHRVIPGADLVFYGAGGHLEYDIVLAPGASPKGVEVAFNGADRVTQDGEGNLVITAGKSTIRQLRPHVYQLVNGQRQEVASEYRVRGTRVQFSLGQFRRDRELVIDPVIQYAAYVGKAGQDSAVAIAVDASGNSYITGETNSGGLAAGRPIQDYRAGDTDAFVAKLNPAGAVEFLTYLGGKLTDTGLGIALDASGNILVTGVTYSEDFPVKGAVRETFGGGAFDVFVAKMNSTGTQLVWSTFLGGAGLDWSAGIAADSTGGAWIAGWTTSRDFPLRDAFQAGTAGGGEDTFLTRIDARGVEVTYSTYFGGEGRDVASGIAVDSRDQVYVTGGTTSTIFPFTAAVQGRAAGGQDAFLYRLDPVKKDLGFATLLGGVENDFGVKVAVDGSGEAVLVGYTQSPNFPVSASAAQRTLGGATDMFIARVGPSRLSYSTLIGGSGDDWAGGVVLDTAGSAYVSGWTNSANFPVRNALQPAYAGGNVASQRFDAAIIRVSPEGNTLFYSSFLGGAGEDKAYALGLDRAGNVYVTGSTTSSNFPSALNQFGSATPAAYDGFVARLSADAVNLLAATPAAVAISARSTDAQIGSGQIAVAATGDPIPFTASSSAPWLRVDPASGTTPASVRYAADAALLQSGVNSAEITIRSASNTVTVPVTITLMVAPAITSAVPARLDRGTADVTVTLAGGGFASTSFVEINGTRAMTSWVDARTLRFVVPGSLLTADGILAITVVNSDGRSNSFSLPVTAPGPVFAGSGVVHAATNAAGAVAPGQMLVIGGTGFGPQVLAQAPALDGRYGTMFETVRVLFDDVAAPILWVASGRVAVVTPYSIAGRDATDITLEANGRRSAAIRVPVQPATPGLFTTDSSGRGQAAAYNDSGSLNSPGSPAARGSVLVLYGTGGGLTDQPVEDGTLLPATGLVRPVLPLSVTIGGIPARVEYAGGVPGQVTGLFQLNVVVPEGVTTGDAVPVVVSAGMFSSPATGVTVAIR